MHDADLWFLWTDCWVANHQPMVRVVARDYTYDGVLVSVFRKRGGAVRAVVEDRDGRLFIHNAEQIKLVSGLRLAGDLPAARLSKGVAGGHVMWPWKKGYRWPWQRIEQQLRDMERRIMLDLSSAIDEITRQRTVIAGAKIAFNEVTKALNDLKMHPAFDEPEAQKAIDQVVADMKANTDALAIAINTNANTTDPNAPAPQTPGTASAPGSSQPTS